MLAKGSTFGRYRIEEEAGRGGMGVVYRARQLRPDRIVALKVLSPELAEDPEFRLRFERESAIAASIEHPHVVPVYEVDEADGLLFIAMRFVEGADLRALIKGRGLGPEGATRIVNQVARALDAAHAAGLVHRDVKPANVLVSQADDEPHAYLTDFGLTKPAGGGSADLTKSGGFVGTIDYVAPEQIGGEQLDARADVYALACVLYECLAGQVPFPRETTVAKLWAHMNDPPPELPVLGGELSARFQDILARGMAKRREDRFASAGDLGRAALAAARGTTVALEERTVAAGDARALPPAEPTVLRSAPGAAGTGVTPSAPATGLTPPTSVTGAAGAPAVRPSGVTGAGPAGATALTGAPQPLRLALPRPLQVPPGAPLVGREPELERLRWLWEQVALGQPAAVAVGGEAGVGKTRLVAELACGVHAEGALVLYGRCDEGLAVPYQPFLEALRPYARGLGSELLRAQLGRLAPELGRLLPELDGLGEPLRADPETERFALFEAVSALFEAATRDEPALLVLDDLQWAAGPTLLLLRHLIRSERPVRLLVLGTYRHTELDPGHPLSQLLADLRRDASAHHMSIQGLDREGIAALLESAAGCPLEERASGFVQVLYDQTAGNPFFARELVAHLLESGALYRAGDHLTSDRQAAEVTVPEGLRHVIGQRVARLSEPARRALEVAAVATRGFSLFLIGKVLGEDEAVLIDALDEAVSRGLVLEAADGHYTFAHALVRQTLYEGLGPARRIRLHGAMGEALEALSDVETHVEALAHHFAEAATEAQAEKAAHYALVAGARATTRLGFEETVAHYERGLKALQAAGDPAHDELRYELLVRLGQARWSAGLEGAREACLQAAELAERVGDPERFARAALEFSGPLRLEAAESTRPVAALLERALVALGEEESPLRARVMGRLAAALAHSHMDEARPELAREALEMARGAGDEAALADVLATTHFAIEGPDSLEERIGQARDLARLADELKEGTLKAMTHAWLSSDLLELGDVAGSERELAQLERLAEELRERYPRWLVGAARARRAHLEGRLEESEALAQETVALGLEGDDESAKQLFGVQLLFLRAEQGRLDELVDAVKAFAEQFPEMVAWRCGLAWAYAELDRREDARRELEALARNGFGDVTRDALWLLSISNLSGVVALLEDASRAEVLYEQLLPYGGRCVVVLAAFTTGSAARSLGLLATTVGRFEDAERHFEDALEMNTRIRSPLWLAHTRHDYARMLLRRDGPGDREKARGLLADALESAERLGLVALARRARPLAEAATAAP